MAGLAPPSLPWPTILVTTSLLAIARAADHQPWSPLLAGTHRPAPVLLLPGPRLPALPGPPHPAPAARRTHYYYRRRRPRRRRRYWQRARPRYRRVRRVEGRGARRDTQLEAGEGRGFVRSVRNLFGAPEHCLEEGRQFSCTFAPVCWITGGVVSPGTAVFCSGRRFSRCCEIRK